MISPSSSLSSRRRSRRSKTNGRYAPVVQKMVLVVSCLVGIGGFYSFCGLSVLLLPSSSHAFSMVSPTKPLARRTVIGSNHNGQNGNTNTDSNSNSNSNSALCMAPKSPQPRQPRRMLKKRTPKDGDRRRRNSRRRNASTAVDSSGAGHPQRTALGILGGGNNSNNKQTMAANANANTNAFRSEPQLLQEYRPLVPSVRRDMGEDYWIDPADLEKEQRRIEAQQRQNAERRSSSNNPSAQTISQEKLMTEVKAPYRQNWIGYFSLMVAVLSIIVSQFPELLEPAPITRFPDL